LHVIGVIFWIGGVAMVTAVILPAARSDEIGTDRLRAFEAIERRFIWIARLSILVVGVTGFYMASTMDLWDRFASLSYWWMHAMVLVWLIFAVVVFIAEPLYLHAAFRRWATVAPDGAFVFLMRAHWFLLLLSLLTVFGAVAGSHGWLFL
jgi:uncharacterized membrane protein